MYGKGILHVISLLDIGERDRNIVVAHDGRAAQHGGALPVDTVYRPPKPPLVLDVGWSQSLWEEFVHDVGDGHAQGLSYLKKVSK
jgi:hypothetical protein